MRLRIEPTLPYPYDEDFHWIKADMIYTVGFGRLFVPHDGKDSEGRRIYDPRAVTPEELEKIQHCILIGLGLDD